AFGFYLAAWTPTLLYLLYLDRVGAGLDPGPIAAGYLGTVLLGAAALAVGLLASSLTRNQLVAATLSFVAFLAALLAGARAGHRGGAPPLQPVPGDGGLRPRDRRHAAGDLAPHGGRAGARRRDGADRRAARSCARGRAAGEPLVGAGRGCAGGGHRVAGQPDRRPPLRPRRLDAGVA